MMQHIMVDLETLGTVPGCVILSIGAVTFSPLCGTIGDPFYCVVNRQSCVDAFLAVDPETEKWWDRQSEGAKEVLRAADSTATSEPLDKALDRFDAYVERLGGKKEARVWGNGSDFDNGILHCAYDALKRKPSWKENRCYRTVKNMARNIKIVRSGTYHNALDDARSQAGHILEIVAAKGLVLA